MGSTKMWKRTRNVQCMKFYEACKKNPSDGNGIPGILQKNFG